MRSLVILNIEIIDKYCFFWSILAYLHPCENSHPSRNSNYRQYFTELNIEQFDFSKGFRCSRVHIIEKLNNLSKNIIELNFYQDRNTWKHSLIPIVIIKIESDRNVDLLIFNYHYVLLKN